MHALQWMKAMHGWMDECMHGWHARMGENENGNEMQCHEMKWVDA